MRERQTIFRHQGYEMRSHSETRWAAMMDALRISWLYEPRVVKTRHGWYLPDFYLPAAGIFVEVKGPMPTQEEREKAEDTEAATGCPVLFAYGKPEMLHGELFHGLVSYFGGKGDVTYSTAEIGSAVRRHFDIHTYCAYMSAGEHKERPDVVHIGEVLAEVISGWMDRATREQYLRQIHAPMNELKSGIHRQASPAEYVLSALSRRVMDLKSAQEAA